MALMDATLGRPMFAGGPPTAPPIQAGGMVGTPPIPTPLPAPSAAVGTGITTGLVPPNEMGAVQPGPDDMAILENVATSMVNTDMAIDSAEDYEGLMNAVRGDVRSEQERRSELAEYVGPEDANQTPESVLAGFVQPQLVMMQAQNSVPNGGLGTAPLDIGGAPPVLGGAPPLPGGLPSVSGEPPVNFPDASFVQAPGTEEASARIAMGEPPVRMARGGDALLAALYGRAGIVPPDQIQEAMNANSRQDPGAVPSEAIWDPRLSVYSAGRPEIALIDEKDVAATTQKLIEFQQPYFDKWKPGPLRDWIDEKGVPQPGVISQRRAAAEQYLTPQVSTAQTRAELEALYGPGLEKEAGIGANLAFAQAGLDIAQTPGTLLQGAIRAGGPLGESIGEIAGRRADFERGLISTARGESLAAAAARRGEEMGVVTSAMEWHSVRTSSWLEAQANTALEMQKLGMELEKANVLSKNDQSFATYEAANAFGREGSESWGKRDEETGEWSFISVLKGPEGKNTAYVDGQVVPIPDGYAIMNSATIEALDKDEIDMTKGTWMDILLPDKTAFAGLRQVTAFATNGRILWFPKGGDNPIVIDSRYAGWFRGKLDDAYEVSKVDDVGRVWIKYKAGPLVGQTRLAGVITDEEELEIIRGDWVNTAGDDTGANSGNPVTGLPGFVMRQGPMKGIVPNIKAMLDAEEITADEAAEMLTHYETQTIQVPIRDAQGNIPSDWRENASNHRMVEITRPVDNRIAYALIEPLYAKQEVTFSDGSKQKIDVLVKENMNPLVENIGQGGVPYAKMSASDIALKQARITQFVAALDKGQEILPSIAAAVGPLDTVKAFIGNNLAIFMPDGAEQFLLWQETSRARSMINNFRRQLVAAMALSDRYAVAEQEIISALAITPEGFFQSEKITAVQFQELLRFAQNDVARHRAQLEDRDILQIRSIPTGAKNDPFIFNGYGQMQYLQKAADEGYDLSGKFMSITVDQAKRHFDPAYSHFWKGRKDSDTIEIKLGKKVR